MVEHSRAACTRLIRSIWLVLFLALPGCAASKPQPATITFAYPMADSAYFQPLAREFMQANPHITVDLSPKTWEQLTSLTANDMDISLISEYSLDALLQSNSITSLSSLLEKDAQLRASDFVTGTIELCTREGEVWAIPARLVPSVVFYNQDLFDARKVPYPQPGWTWDDFLRTALACTDAEGGIYGYGYAPGGIEPVLFIYQHGGRVFDDWTVPRRATCDEPRTVEALEWYSALVHIHKVAPPYAEAAYYMARGVVTGKVAMWIGTLADPQSWTWSTRWGMVPLPRDKEAATFLWMDVFVVSSKAESAAACWQWLKFLSAKTSDVAVPARKSVLAADAYAKQVDAQTAMVARASVESALIFSGHLRAAQNAAWEALIQAFDATLRGELTPRQALERAQQAP